jgi:hypothetical protein
MATNKYTRPVLLSNLKSISPKNFNTFNTFVNAISPRAGADSAQIAALNTVLGYDVQAYFTNTNIFAGSIIKKNLISAVKSN